MSVVLILYPSKWYSAPVSGMRNIGVFSLVGQVLAERNWKASNLIDRLDKRGYTFDRKTVYRLTQPLPIERIGGRLVRALCEVFQLAVEDLISLEPPRLRKIDAKSDKRLSELMEKNSRGELSEREREEFQVLGAAAGAEPSADVNSFDCFTGVSLSN
jgi:Cro/C1-type HTH DNA-binding domain